VPGICVNRKVTRLLVTVLIALPVLLPAQDCSKPFDSPLAPGRQLSIDVRAGDIEITGTKAAALRVTCKLPDDPSRAKEVKISLAAGRLRISGGSNKSVRIRIEVPEKTNLIVRSTAGDMKIAGITGDKDVELNAGNLTIQVGDPASYRVAEGSVMAGDMNAKVFGETKGGMFSSFRKENSKGQYRLRAKLMAGDLTLK
jgi:hypothetical protein